MKKKSPKSRYETIMFSRVISRGCVRLFTSSRLQAFLFFGKKEKKTQQEIVENQDKFEIDPDAAITFLNEANSPNTVQFDPNTDMPNFKVRQWMQTKVASKDIEATYTPESLVPIINSTYEELTTKPLSKEQYEAADLRDLQFRFSLAKSLQQKLGFELNDYQISKAHSVSDLYNVLAEVVSTRWVSERMPQAIVLRPEDFTSGNIYLNQEASQKEQQRKLEELVEKARSAEE